MMTNRQTAFVALFGSVAVLAFLAGSVSGGFGFLILALVMFKPRIAIAAIADATQTDLETVVRELKPDNPDRNNDAPLS